VTFFVTMRRSLQDILRFHRVHGALLTASDLFPATYDLFPTTYIGNCVPAPANAEANATDTAPCKDPSAHWFTNLRLISRKSECNLAARRSVV
jgi:hypothetical protein